MEDQIKTLIKKESPITKILNVEYINNEGDEILSIKISNMFTSSTIKSIEKKTSLRFNGIYNEIGQKDSSFNILFSTKRK